MSECVKYNLLAMGCRALHRMVVNVIFQFQHFLDGFTSQPWCLSLGPCRPIFVEFQIKSFFNQEINLK